MNEFDSVLSIHELNTTILVYQKKSDKVSINPEYPWKEMQVLDLHQYAHWCLRTKNRNCKLVWVSEFNRSAALCAQVTV